MCDAAGPVCPLQREILPSTRLGTLPPAFSTRVLPAQATEYAFAFIQVPQDVSLHPFLPPKGARPLTVHCCGPSTYSRELNAKPCWVPPSTPWPTLTGLRPYCGPGLGPLPLACWAPGCSCLPMLLPASDGATRSDVLKQICPGHTSARNPPLGLPWLMGGGGDSDDGLLITGRGAWPGRAAWPGRSGSRQGGLGASEPALKEPCARLGRGT